MEELRWLAVAAGFLDVTTVGASGNILYSSTCTPAVDSRRLSDVLVKRLGRATVALRDAASMRKIARAAPFVVPDARVPDKWRFVAFLEHPSDATLPLLPSGSPVRFAGRTKQEVFYTMAEPTSHAIAMVARLERALDTSLTVRNWNVVRSIADRIDEHGPR